MNKFIEIEQAAMSGAYGGGEEPTEDQKLSGNYKKGRFDYFGIPVAIEQPRHSYRTGVDSNGKRWSSRMAAHYGYITGTKGADGDGVDVFVGYYPQSERVYVINQKNKSGGFDEHKVMLAFPDKESAVRAYEMSFDSSWGGLGVVVDCSIEQLKWWLKNADLARPLFKENLPFEDFENMKRVNWADDESATPLGVTIERVLYDVRRNDGEGLLLDSVTSDEILEDSDEVLVLDALVVPFVRLERQMGVMQRVMDRASGEVKPISMQVTSPFRQHGTANVAVVFELSDGQTVSVFFHNPDVNPRGIKPQDELVSWKWVLNKKDITIVVAPERGQDINVRFVARRIMALAEKNSAAFKRANQKRAERMEKINGLKSEITDLESQLKRAEGELDLARANAEERQAATPVPEPVAEQAPELDPVVDPDPIVEPAVEPEPAPEPAVDPVVEPVAEQPPSQFNVGDAVIWANANGEVSGQYRGPLDGVTSVIMVSGMQMNAPTSELRLDGGAAEDEPAAGAEATAAAEAATEGWDGLLAPEGVENNVKTAKGTQVSTGFAVVEADALIASHDISGNENPDYPQELQPRDRSRDASVAWVKKTAANLDPDSLGRTSRADSGAPIVGPDRVVESGNGRVMAIIEAYRSGQAGEYREWLTSEADFFGLSEEKIAAMRAPVLVRVRTADIDRATFAVEANQDDKLAMTATEKAKSDANRLDDHAISLMGESGDLTSGENLPFLQAFLRSLGDAEAAQYITSDGKPTASLIARVQAAIFAKAYEDERLLELTADVARPEIANIINALNSAAPEFIKARAANPDAADHASSKITDGIELSLDETAVQSVIGAINIVRDARDKGMDVGELVSQMGLFDQLDPNVAAMAVFISKNNRSARRLGVAFKAIAEFIKTTSEHSQTVDMFGDSAPVSLAEVIDAANRALSREYGEGEFAIDNLGLFDQPAAGPEPTPEVAPEPVESVVVSEISTDTYNNWLKVDKGMFSSVGQWRLFPEGGGRGPVLLRKYKDHNAAGGGYMYAEMATGFASAESAKEWAKKQPTKGRTKDQAIAEAEASTPVENNQPEQEPMQEPIGNSEENADKDFLKSIIDGSVDDILDPGLAERLEQVLLRNEGDADTEKLFMEAAAAYEQAMMRGTESIA